MMKTETLKPSNCRYAAISSLIYSFNKYLFHAHEVLGTMIDFRDMAMKKIDPASSLKELQSRRK